LTRDAAGNETPGDGSGIAAETLAAFCSGTALGRNAGEAVLGAMAGAGAGDAFSSAGCVDAVF
jgi:hypothetical protein